MHGFLSLARVGRNIEMATDAQGEVRVDAEDPQTRPRRDNNYGTETSQPIAESPTVCAFTLLSTQVTVPFEDFQLSIQSRVPVPSNY